MRRSEEVSVLELYFEITLRMRDLEARKACALCRGDIRSVRVLWEDLAALQLMYDSMEGHPERREWLLRAAEIGDRVGVLAFLARIWHRVRGFEPRSGRGGS